MQRRELDRDAGPGVDAAAGRGAADRLDRVLVGGEIAPRRRARSSPLRRACRRSSGSPRASRGRALASACSIVSPVTNCSPIRRIAMSTPRRISGSPPRPTTRRSAAPRPTSLCVATSLPVSSSPQVAALTNSDGLWPRCDAPVAARDLVADQRVAGGGVGNAQQRLGQAHQGHAFARAEGEFLQQALHQAGPARIAGALAHAAGDTHRQLVGSAVVGRRQAGLLEQGRQQLGLGRARRGGDGRAQRRGEERRGDQGAACQS